MRNLKKYLLPRYVQLKRRNLDGQALEDFANRLDWANLTFKGDKLYSHKIMRLKYTTYDARRDEDVIHLDTDQCNLMLLKENYSPTSPPNRSQPFHYCKVIAMLHAEVGYAGNFGRSEDGKDYTYYTMEFLWVRWYDVQEASDNLDLHQAVLRPIEEPGSHSFIDPLHALRACHIIPRFKDGLKYSDGVGKSKLVQDGSDWNRYYINRYEQSLNFAATLRLIFLSSVPVLWIAICSCDISGAWR